MNVAENACENCHATHNATAAVMLTVDNEEQTCYRCHNGSVAALNLQSESQKFYRHPVDLPSGRDHREEHIQTTFSTPLHVECEDCHNPHAVRKDEPMISFNPGNPTDTRYNRAPLVNGYLLGVSGLDINGQPKHEADYEYEVCFKCHGVRGRSACENNRCSTATNLQMARQDETYNLREKFDSNSPSLESYHPVYNNDPSNDFEVPSLRLDIPLQREGSLIYCGDCHSGDFSPSAGGNGASGPHGSRHAAMVSLRYALDPNEQANWVISGALCFKCHDRSNLLSDESFLHSLHVVGARKGCVNCHDPHGSNVYPHLINFLTTASASGQILEITGAPSYPSQPLWRDNGRYSGSCSLTCHGVVHEGSSYGMPVQADGF
jgi:predicted CXXCH cytochrome family protein